jgi:hypothetical protein
MAAATQDNGKTVSNLDMVKKIMLNSILHIKENGKMGLNMEMARKHG